MGWIETTAAFTYLCMHTDRVYYSIDDQLIDIRQAGCIF